MYGTCTFAFSNLRREELRLEAEKAAKKPGKLKLNKNIESLTIFWQMKAAIFCITLLNSHVIVLLLGRKRRSNGESSGSQSPAQQEEEETVQDWQDLSRRSSLKSSILDYGPSRCETPGRRRR
jgi:hypothetical protein